MSAILEPHEVQNQTGKASTCEWMQDLTRRAAEASAGMEDAKMAAQHWAKRARYATEDLADDVMHGIKHYPVRSLGVAFGAGAVLGTVLAGSFLARRSQKGARK